MKKRESRKSKRPSKREECIYCIEILDWEMPYSLSVNRNKKIITGPYWEHINLKLTGKLFQPEKLSERTIQIDILGDRTKETVLEYPEKYEYEPKAVGTLTARGKITEFLGSVPFNVLLTISLLLWAGKIKILVLSGQSLYRGSTDITSIHFQKDYNPEDWM
jgi:hypothetical protein